jgi:hypothetical protein
MKASGPSTRPFIPFAHSIRLTLPGRRKYNFVSGNYCFGGHNGNIYYLSSALFKTQKDAWFSNADEHQGRKKGLEEQKGQEKDPSGRLGEGLSDHQVLPVSDFTFAAFELQVCTDLFRVFP